jgi:predicted transposase YbfD/YdcC
MTGSSYRSRHLRSFVVAQSVIALADREPVGPAAPGTVTGVYDDLLKLFGSVSDGRSGQGRDHPVAAVLALAAAAVVAGMKGYTAIAGWVKDVPPPVLADLYLRAGAAPAPPPSKATIWRVITDADAEMFDATVGSWLMGGLLAEPAAQDADSGAGHDDPVELMPVRLDGKTVRGAKDPAGSQRHLLAALVGRTAQSSVVAAQAEVGGKTNEVPMAKVVLSQIDLNGKLVTADALHTVKATAEFICQGGGEFVLPVKENRKALFDALNGLPWHQVPIAHSATDRGHGRITTRTIQVLPAPEDLPFPHVSQVLLIERYVSDLKRQPCLGGSRPRRGQPRPRPGHCSRPGPSRTRAMGDRGVALAARHPVSRRQITGQNPVRAQNHGSTTTAAVVRDLQVVYAGRCACGGARGGAAAAVMMNRDKQSRSGSSGCHAI